MPSISVRAYAELIHTPLYGQLRILQEQKYPKQAPGIFKIQYYRPALLHITKFYRTGEPTNLPSNKNDLMGVGENEARIDHNFRVISKFRQGSQIDREFVLRPAPSFERTFGKMTIRATPDFVVDEDGTIKYLLYDMRSIEPDEEIIRTTVELFHYIASKNGVESPMSNVEYICVDCNKVFRWKNHRERTIKRARSTSSAIRALWDSI